MFDDDEIVISDGKRIEGTQSDRWWILRLIDGDDIDGRFCGQWWVLRAVVGFAGGGWFCGQVDDVIVAKIA